MGGDSFVVIHIRKTKISIKHKNKNKIVQSAVIFRIVLCYQKQLLYAEAVEKESVTFGVTLKQAV